jgi:hypothetical protein
VASAGRITVRFGIALMAMKVLDGLVGGAILTETHRVVGKDPGSRDVHDAERRMAGRMYR